MRPLKQCVEQLLTAYPGQRNPTRATSIWQITSGLAGPSSLASVDRNAMEV